MYIKPTFIQYVLQREIKKIKQISEKKSVYELQNYEGT